MADETKHGPWTVTASVRTGAGTFRINGVETSRIEKVADGSTVTIEAVAAAGYTFEKWEHWTDTGGYETVGNSPTYTFTANAGVDSMPSYPAFPFIFLFASFTPAPAGSGKLLCGRSGALLYGKSGTLLYGDKKMT